MTDLRAHEDLVNMLFEHALGPSGDGDDLHCVAANEIIRLREKLETLRKAIKFVVDELEEDFDCDDGQPNKAMKLANELDEALYGPGGF